MNKRIVSIALSLLLFVSGVFAQSFNSSTDFSKLSDAQTKRIANEISKNGYSIAQVEAIGKAKGMTDQQISDLKARLYAYEESRSSNKTTRHSNFERIDMSASQTSEKIIFEVSDKDKSIFGFSLFNNQDLSFEPDLNLPVPEGYILGPGDELMIDIWGQAEMSYDLIVTQAGTVDIPSVGPIYVAGASFKEAKARIESKLKNIFSDLGGKTSMSIRTGQLRTITVNVVGEAYLPGTYTVSGAASLFNVLYLSGGPNSKGSFRNIQLIRQGKIVATLDVYDFLLKGNPEVNVPLYNNDMIMIPTYNKRVRVEGAVKRPGVYEAIDGETVKDFLQYAGGLTPLARMDVLGLTRIGAVGMLHQDIAMDEASSVSLVNGDGIHVYDIESDRMDNVVRIVGAGVFMPGTYEFKPGMKLSDLLKKAGGLKEDAYMVRGLITRLKDDYSLESLGFSVAELASGKYDLELKDKDRILITDNDNMQPDLHVTIKGAVRHPGRYQYRENITVGDLVFLADGLTNTAATMKVDIVRRLPHEVADTSMYTLADSKTISITRDLDLNDLGNSEKLEPFDIVTVRVLPYARFRGTVRITGEVKFAGTYELLTKNDNIKSIIERAGGLTPNAYLDGAKMFRDWSSTAKERILRHAIAQKLDTLDWQAKYTNFETVSVDFNGLMNDPTKDIILQDGDEIEIPCKSETVVVEGQVLSPISVLFQGRVSARKVIKQAGGFAPKALKKHTYVLYADGHAEQTKHFLFFKRYPKVMPGCRVRVPVKPDEERMSVTERIAVTSALASVMMSTALICKSLL